ncbi:MAG TPA: hypothetical protein VGM64_04370 [Lacunisphaera sp.]
MKSKLNSPRSALFNLGSARSHARLARQLARSSGHSSDQFASTQSLFGSLWSPVRLDLLKVPLTRHHE